MPAPDPDAAGRRDVLDLEALRGLRPAAWTLVGLYAVFSVTHWFFLPEAQRRVMVPLTAAESLAVLGILGLWSRWPPRPSAAHAWMVLLGALALLNSGALLGLAQEPKQATNLFFLLLGGGFLLLRRPHFVAYTVSILAVFATAALLGPPSGDWTHYAFGMVSAVALSGVVHEVRRASTLRLDRARHEAEENVRRLRTVLTAAPLVLFAVDRQGVFTLAEGRGLGNLGLQPEDLLGRRIQDVYAASPAMPAVQRALAGEPMAMTVEEQGRLFDVVYHPLPDGGFVGVATDVTDRRRAEQALRQAREEADEATRLRELDRLRTSFVNIAAHELNTPLTPIQMQLSLVDTPDADRRGKAARILRRNVDRLARIVNDLVAVNRLQQGRLEVRPAAIDVARVAHDSAESFRDAAAARGVDLQVAADSPAPAWGDAERLHQVVDNLVSNALKFTPRGGSIQVAVAPDPGPPAGVRVEVHDTGPGIAAEDLPRLFRPFAQLEAGRQAGGTGLGLHISQGIVQAHGGRIWAASAGPGRGTTFAFTVPATQPTTNP